MLDDWHIMVVVLIFALIFGAKKLPDIGSGLGKGIKNFKSSLKELKKDESADGSEDSKDEKNVKDDRSS